MRRHRLIETKTLGKIPSGYVSNIPLETNENIKLFVNNEINEGPQVVSLPTPPYRHAFLVNITPDAIKISDWGGEQNINTKNNAFKNYRVFMNLLKEKYHPRNIQYYPIDAELNELANQQHDMCNGGGCSNYTYAWIKKHEKQIWEDASTLPITAKKRSRSRSRSKSTSNTNITRKKRSKTVVSTKSRKRQRTNHSKI